MFFLLIQHGADIHAADHNGWTPFLRMVELAPGAEYDTFMQFLEWWPSQQLSDNAEEDFQDSESTDNVRP